jgi:hypothetical protein
MTPTDKITHAIIINQIALNNNEALKFTPFYKQGLKNKLNQLMPELYNCEPEYDEFFNSLEDSTSDVYDVYEKYTKEIASVPIWDCENITLIIEAYKKDPKSIEGICKKILR